MPETLLILRSQQLGVSTAAVLLLWAALHVVRSSASFVGGRLTDRIGANRTMWLGWLAYTGVAVGFAVARGAGAAWTLFLAFGIVAGLTESPERALVAQFAGPHQGSGFGMYHGVTGLAALAGGIGLGAVFQAYGAGPAFFGSAAGGLALTVVWPVVMMRRVA
jgi:MFS family permease